MKGLLPTLGAGAKTLGNGAQTLGNPQTQSTQLAELLAMYQRAERDRERGEAMGSADYIPNSGAVGVLAAVAQALRGKHLRRRADENAESLTSRILTARREEEAAQKERERAAKEAERDREIAWRREQAKRFLKSPEEAEEFAITGKVPSAPRLVPQMTDQGLVMVDPHTGQWRPATPAGASAPQGLQGADGVPVHIDPSIPPEIAAQIEAAERSGQPVPSQMGAQTPVLRPHGAARQDRAEARADTQLQLSIAAANRAGRAESRADEAHRIALEEKNRLRNLGKALPANVVEQLTKQAEISDNTASLLTGFKDSFAGNRVGGSVENMMGRLGVPGATPGQADWWQSYDRQRNIVRNELFGAALSASEQAAFEAADINPNMDPKRIRANLQMQNKIIRSALGRRGQVWRAQGYNADAIDAATRPTAAPASAPASGWSIRKKEGR